MRNILLTLVIGIALLSFLIAPDDKNVNAESKQNEPIVHIQAMQQIDGSPLDISVKDDLSVAVYYEGREQYYNEFDSGTFLVVDDIVYGPQPGVSQRFMPESFTPISNSVGGDGTEANPFTIITVVSAGETGLQLTQTTSYVNGDIGYSTHITIDNNSTTTKDIRLFHAADLYLNFPETEADYGFGFYDPATGAVGGASEDQKRIQVFKPVPDFMPDAYQESTWGRMDDEEVTPFWRYIGIEDAAPGPGFNNTVDSERKHDIAAGFQWNRTIEAGTSTTVGDELAFGLVEEALPTPTPTSPTTPTPTPMPATATPMVATATPILTVTATPMPATPTPIAQATSTPMPATSTPILLPPTSTPIPTATPTTPADPSTCPPDQYLAEYFNNKDLEGEPAFTYCEDDIDRIWGYSTQPPPSAAYTNLNEEDFSVRWTARTKIEKGRYFVSTFVDDGLVVSVGGVPLIDHWHLNPAVRYERGFWVNETGDYDIEVRYFEHEHIAFTKVEWFREILLDDEEIVYPEPGTSPILPFPDETVIEGGSMQHSMRMSQNTQQAYIQAQDVPRYPLTAGEGWTTDLPSLMSWNNQQVYLPLIIAQ